MNFDFQAGPDFFLYRFGYGSDFFQMMGQVPIKTAGSESGSATLRGRPKLGTSLSDQAKCIQKDTYHLTLGKINEELGVSFFS